jgi:hypothetical protein
MSNPSILSLQLTAGSSNGIALSQTPAAAGLLTLNGALVTGGVALLVPAGSTFTARRVLVSSTGTDTTVVFTIKGTNASGASITDTVTGVVSGSPVNSNYDFATVTSVSASAGTSGAITVGTSSTASTPWILDNFLIPTWTLAVAVYLPAGIGSATYTVEHTYDDPNATSTGTPTPPPAQFSMAAGSQVPAIVWPDPVLNNMTSSGETTFVGRPIMAHRLTVTAGTGQAIMYSMQSGIGNAS